MYEQADALGHALATNNLGALYADGQGVEPNLPEARRLYEKAARAGIPLAMKNLGFFFERGQGGPKDYEQARYWYEKAAESGLALAAHALGVMYQNGYGVAERHGDGSPLVREGRRGRSRPVDDGGGIYL
jgi:TPR repeat protein